ncbi:phage tail protein [Roseateles puraquae]|uniref:Phage tail protein n=1 Tax=Roseateles puraquae TaxID=431059 RepID=A0A254NHE8_9BURK|nr:tail fiber protein [Roseateles puraquae]MDG0855623.1 phage tail protein [Roseateles puraquae]OWR04668.1 phage tail protein [Roseateles puraquae]
MPDPYVGELRLFAGTFAPSGWALCQGQLVPISESDMLFNLIGTTYGGDGQNNFALPDLRGRVPVHQGQGPGLTPRTIGQSGGSESVTLQTSEVPVHTHTLFASTAAASGGTPAGQVLATTTAATYAPGPVTSAMAAGAITSSGDNPQPHENMAPTVTLNYIISLYGIYPSPN